MTTTTASFAPVSLSYMAALRGIKPRHPGEAFTYAAVNCRSAELLIGLAASNPEGQFYGLIGDTEACANAVKKAAERQTGNVAFLNVKTANLVSGAASLPQLDYLVCDESQQVLTNIERAALFDLAAAKVKASGLFNYNYRAYADETSALRFLVREFSPEMSVEQASDFLIEIKKLGHLYMQSHPDVAAKLDQAIAKNVPDDFFINFDDGEARSATFDTVVAMRTRGLAYAGAGHVEANYVELSIPAEAQDIVIQCRDNPLCESIKDFASQKAFRSDIWVKQPATTSAAPAELFGSFAYGITLPKDKVPSSVEVFGKTVDLSSTVYSKLVELMTIQPVTVGDCLQHPDSKDLSPTDIVGAIQILVALGIARPMRGAHEAGNISSMAQPRFSGSFNRYIDRVSVANETFAMASRVMGDVIDVSPRDVLVMQALNRGGLANSASALLSELQKLAKDPAVSARVSDLAEPTPESAHQMINDVVNQSFVQWYAYGLLEAA